MPTLHIVGQVSDRGTVAIGSGFQVTRTGTGNYEIDYSENLPSEAIVLATGIAEDGDTVRTTTLYDSSLAGFRISIENSGGTDRDASFNFAVMLPDS